MKELGKHLLRVNRASPVCLDLYLWGRYSKCEFMVKDGNLYGCKAGGIRAAWSVRESKTFQGMQLATYNDILKHRNHHLNSCTYRFIGWGGNVARPIGRLLKWVTDLIFKLRDK
jgi:hypothetical protein